MLERRKMDRDAIEIVGIDTLVSQEHLLRKIDAAVNFERLYEMVEPLYCEDDGRPSIAPVVLFKMVLVQHAFFASFFAAANASSFFTGTLHRTPSYSAHPAQNRRQYPESYGNRFVLPKEPENPQAPHEQLPPEECCRLTPGSLYKCLP